MTQTKKPAPPQDRLPAESPSARSLYRAEDGHQAPDADDRLDAAFEAEARARGYRLSMDCLDCGHPIVTEVSLRRHRGPRCAARAAQAVVTDA